MRTRHRVPSIFNLYMVDVLCCALGCVILLLLLHVYRARAYEKEAKATQEKQQHLLWDLEEESKEWENKYNATAEELAALAAELKKANLRIASLDAEVKDKDEAIQDAKARADGLALKVTRTEKELAEAREDRKIALLKLNDLEKELVKRVRDLEDAEKTLTGLEKARQALAKELEAKGKTVAELLAARAALEKEQDATAKKLEGIERQKALLAAALSKKEEELDTAREFKDKHAKAEDRILDILKQLSEAKQDLRLARGKLDKVERDKEELQKGINDLEVQKRRIQEEADRRFAGIALTGKRVIFLIDASGSMNILDKSENPAPEKWKEVRDTVAQVMQSLSKLEKFQVLIFSPTTRYLLGREGEWIDYDPETSVERVVKALAEEKPSGGTNMYLPLEEAFKFRAKGLDTIYMLSDGMPDRGPGLTVPPPARTTAQVEAMTQVIRDKLNTDWNAPRADPPPGQPRRVRINTIGFFYESPDVGAFLWALARENDGSFVGMSTP